MKDKDARNPENKLNKDITPTLSAIRKKRTQIINIREIQIFLFRLLILVAFFLLIFYGLFGLHAVKNDEMNPRVSPGDLLLFFRYSSTYLADDVVLYQVNGEIHVGRIVAKSGDSVDIGDKAGVYINGNYKLESAIYYDTYSFEEYQNYPVTLDDDEYFILADNRENAKDSRYFGPISNEKIIGKVISLMRRGQL